MKFVRDSCEIPAFQTGPECGYSKLEMVFYSTKTKFVYHIVVIYNIFIAHIYNIELSTSSHI
jgi:hypothetical protein